MTRLSTLRPDILHKITKIGGGNLMPQLKIFAQEFVPKTDLISICLL